MSEKIGDRLVLADGQEVFVVSLVGGVEVIPVDTEIGGVRRRLSMEQLAGIASNPNGATKAAVEATPIND